MKRVLAIFWYYFSWHWGSLVFTAMGGLFLVMGMLVALFGGPAAVIAVPSALLVLPALWATPVFRQLVSNRRLALVPQFRAAAIAALALIAIAGGLLTALYAARQSGALELASSLRAGLLAYGLVSAYLLVNQWFCTFRAGLYLQVGTLLLIVRFLAADGVDMNRWLDFGPALAAVATLGWAVLWLLIRRQTAPAGPSTAQKLDTMSEGRMSFVGLQWLPAVRLAGPASPSGTLMRGSSDGWLNRIIAMAVCVVGFAALWFGWMYLVGNALANRQPEAAIGLFLLVSFFAIVFGTPLVITEWPSRLRYLWLRTHGDRALLWRCLERVLLQEAGLVGACTALVALAVAVTTATPAALLFAYVAGTSLGFLLSAYFAIWFRQLGESIAMLGFCLTLIWVPVFWIIVAIVRTAGAANLLWLLLPAVGIASLLRAIARRKFLTVDWCALRPARRQAATSATRGAH